MPLIKVNLGHKVPPKQKGHRQNRDTIKPLSGLNVDELLGREKRKTISVENAVPEFKQLLATAHDPNAIDDASKQMSSVIVSLIKHSLGNSGYGRAVEALGVMREQLIEMEEPKLYNDFITDLKGRILNEELNGERREMWWEIRRNRLGLIDVQESDLSEVGEEEAKLVSTPARKMWRGKCTDDLNSSCRVDSYPGLVEVTAF